MGILLTVWDSLLDNIKARDTVIHVRTYVRVEMDATLASFFLWHPLLLVRPFTSDFVQKKNNLFQVHVLNGALVAESSIDFLLVMK